MERGFRRIVIVLSVAILVIAIGMDVTMAVPDTTVLVTLKDGRQFVLERHAGPKVVTLPVSVGYQLQVEHGVYPEALSSEIVSIIADMKILRGPSYNWRKISATTQIAVLLVMSLWLVFFVLRWIGRGFYGPKE